MINIKNGITKKILTVIVAAVTAIAFMPVIGSIDYAHAAVGSAQGGTIDAKTATDESVADCLGVDPDRVSIDRGARKRVSVRLTHDVNFATLDTTVTVAKDNELGIDLNGYSIYSADAAEKDMFKVEDGANLKISNGQSLSTTLFGGMVVLYPSNAAADANVIDATGVSDSEYDQELSVGQGITMLTTGKTLTGAAPSAIVIDNDSTEANNANIIVNGTIIAGHKDVGAVILGPTTAASATISGRGTAMNTTNDYGVQDGTHDKAFAQSRGSSVTRIIKDKDGTDTAQGVKIVPEYYKDGTKITDTNILKNDMNFKWYRYNESTDNMTLISDATNYYYTPTKADKGYYLIVTAKMKSENSIFGFGYSYTGIGGPVIDTKAISNIKYTISGTSTVNVSGVSKNTSNYTVAKTASIGKGTFKVTSIGAKAFIKATKCKSVTIKSMTITKVGKNAFKKCKEGMIFKLPQNKYSAYKTMLKKSGLPKNVKFKKI